MTSDASPSQPSAFWSIPPSPFEQKRSLDRWPSPHETVHELYADHSPHPMIFGGGVGTNSGSGSIESLQHRPAETPITYKDAMITHPMSRYFILLLRLITLYFVCIS